jgi:4-diphosphocytidyl-2-C-methyl-D-erythritol kinase
MREAIIVTAHAKLTLSLHITGVRSDGYHTIDATMVSIDAPSDLLVLSRARRTSMKVKGPFADGVPADASNLAWRAVEACHAKMRIELHKGIPVGAGLGGGSADAAAVLRALGGSRSLAAALGADVPFCMRGGFARVRGIGDKLESNETPKLSVVVVTPPFACSTGAVYRAWDELGGPRDEVNDLRIAAEHVEPRLSLFRREVEAAAGAPAVLAGSGSSYAVIFADAAEAEQARRRIAAAVTASVWLGSAVQSGVEVAL